MENYELQVAKVPNLWIFSACGTFRESINSAENYKYVYNTFVRPNFGKQRSIALKKSDVKRFYNYLADERGLQVPTIDNVHTVLPQVLDMAVDDDCIRSNPSDGVLEELKQSHMFKTEKRRGLTKPEQELKIAQKWRIYSSFINFRLGYILMGFSHFLNLYYFYL